MAAKIKEGIRDITEGIVERLKGGPKYADNLLGESLQDQLRKATAKDLLAPSEELNSQIVDTINQDVANGKDSKEIVGLLRRRLRTDNPHKQWLAVLLVGRVMRDCSSSLGPHQEELLQEVARTMARPARPDSSTARTTRQAAKELLRSYGRAGTSAFRAVNRKANTVEYTGVIANTETASVVAEVQLLIEQAQANTELLSEMLLVGEQPAGAAGPADAAAAGGKGDGARAGGDEFENELTLELLTEVRELRTLFDAYLEQLQAMSGSEVEAVMLKALEAVDLLDGALALQQDVACNQRELEQQASVTAATGAATAAKPADKKEEEKDLISLDDLADALGPAPAPVPVAAPGPSASAQQPPPQQQPVQQPGAAGTATTVTTTASAALSQDPFATLDTSLLQSTISKPAITSPTGAAVAATGTAAAAHAPYPGLYGGPAHPTLTPQPYSYGQEQQRPAPYPAGQQPQHPQQSYGTYGAAPSMPYHAVQQPQPPQPSYGAYGAAPSMPYGGGPLPVANLNNPFAAPPMPSLPYGSAPTAASQPSGGMSSNNPFAAAVVAPPPAGMGAAAPVDAATGGHSTTMDAEWAMFFAGRAGPPQQQQQPQPQPQPQPQH